MAADAFVVWPAGIGGTSDSEHLKRCTTKACARCTWVKNREGWTSRYPWVDATLDMTQKQFGIGCKWCAAALDEPEFKKLGLLVSGNLAFAKYQVTATDKVPLKKQRLTKHATCPAHQAVASLLGQGTLPEDEAVPAHKDWVAVLEDTLHGNATSTHGVANSFGGKKMHKMQWCLAEAKRDMHRCRLKESLCISISQDKRDTRFLLRFRCANAQLEVTQGVLALSRDVNDVQHAGADGLRRATLKGLEKACTPSKPPFGSTGDAPKFDRALFDEVARKIEVFAADAANDEQLAGRELGPGHLAGLSVAEIRDTVAQNLPNLKAPLNTPTSLPCCS